MCRWLGYFGSPIRLEELVFNAEHSLVEQSRSARFTTHLTNADGFGLGWYGTADGLGRYRSVSPAWSDRNLQDLCAHIKSPLFIAHVRAATGTPVQQTNSHPFRYGRWLFVHNGFIDEYPRLHRELMLAVDPDLFTNIEGTTDAQDDSCPPRYGRGCLPRPDGLWGERGTEQRRHRQRAAFLWWGQGGRDPAGDRDLGALGGL